jgi:hypothetical protein
VLAGRATRTPVQFFLLFKTVVNGDEDASDPKKPGTDAVEDAAMRLARK